MYTVQSPNNAKNAPNGVDLIVYAYVAVGSGLLVFINVFALLFVLLPLLFIGKYALSPVLSSEVMVTTLLFL
jgi:hypothetical protein